MIKEQEIVKNFLMSNFHWVKIDTEGGFESGGSCKRIFEGSICAKGTFYDWNFGDNEKALKKFKSTDECKEWLPDNILHKSIEDYRIDTSGKDRRYQRLTKDIGDAKLILEINQGSISGVGYDKGWEVRVGFIYKDFIFKIYSYKSSNGNYKLECLYDLDYISSIDFSGMSECKDNDSYLAEYYAVSTRNSASLKNMAEVLSLAMDGDTLTFSSQFTRIFKRTRGISSNDNCLFIRETLEELKPKKIVM